MLADIKKRSKLKTLIDWALNKVQKFPGDACLFMGRRVYWSCVIVVVMALHQQRPKGASIYRLQRMFDIDHKTICQWIAYFRRGGAFPLY